MLPDNHNSGRPMPTKNHQRSSLVLPSLDCSLRTNIDRCFLEELDKKRMYIQRMGQVVEEVAVAVEEVAVEEEAVEVVEVVVERGLLEKPKRKHHLLYSPHNH